jgi:Flp pilus assembly protein TadG
MLCVGGDLMLTFYLVLLFFLILCAALIAFGYSLGKDDGLMQGRRDLADYALSLGDDFK